MQKEGKEGPADERGGKGAGAKHQLGQSPRCFQGGQFSHSSKDQGQGISNTNRESTHGRMSAIIFMLPCSDIILRYVVLVYCLEAKVLSRRQPSYQKIFVVLLFLFLIIGSNELYTFLIWLLVLIKTCFELYCYPSVYYHLLLPKTKKIITDFPIGPSMKLC